MRGKKVIIKYVNFYSDEALSDAEVAGFTDAQYRAYWQLIFYLYSNNGKCSADYETLASICMKNPNELIFQSKIWPKVRKKFRIKNRIISHKRVTKELKRARKYIQNKQRAGLMSGRVRRTLFKQHSNGERTIEIENEIERNPSKYSKDNPYLKDKKLGKELDYIDSRAQRLLVSDFASIRLRFIATLEQIIKVYTKSDRIAFVNLTNWLIKEVVQDRFTIQIFGRVLDFAETSKKHGDKPVAYFFGTLRREIGYQRKKS